MKIGVADNNNQKFIYDLIRHWIELGHEVKFEPGASEFLAQWADIYYIDTFDANVHYLYNLYHGKQEIDPKCEWDNNKKPKIVVRALDWEVWLGKARDQEIINWVDKVICIAPHMEKKLRSEADFGEKLKVIKPGVNLEKFTLKKRLTFGFELGMVLGDMWWPKNHMAGLDIFTTLYRQDNRWRLHIRGQHEPGEYWKVMYDHYLESRGIRDVVTLYDTQTDMNQWLEQIDILLHPGMKEAFCYAVGEAMAKGIPVVINEFLGSRDIWKAEDLYQTHQEAVDKLENWVYSIVNHDSATVAHPNRAYIEENYFNEKYFRETDEWMGLI